MTDNEKRIEEMENNIVGMDDIMTFSCDNCGKCCHKTYALTVTPFDIYRISRQLSITPDEWIDLYGDCYIAEESRLPHVLIKQIGESRRCPFLRGNYCSVHKVKPDVCAIYPLGRGRKIRDNENVSEVTYFLPERQCGKNNGNSTVRDYLRKMGLLKHEEYFIKWTDIFIKSYEFINELLKNDIAPEELDKYYSRMFGILYKRYDIFKQFEPQFEENIDMWTQVMNNYKG